jgi:quercetin dioxygenase-like cupin family protein
MALFIDVPAHIKAAGAPVKSIFEYFGRVRSCEDGVSIARMVSPPGWKEPAQSPDFAEYTVVLKGVLRVETKEGTIEVRAGQAIRTERGERVRYSTPEGAEYIAVCLPAFSPEGVHRVDFHEGS